MNNNYDREALSDAGVPYNDIVWYDIVGQPFGTASYFNAIVFGDANNIVDTKGAMAVGRNFVSSRGLELGFGNKGKPDQTVYTPDRVRFLVGGDVAMQGPLVVNGHVVGGRNFRVAGGSTYMIGKDGTADQSERLAELYRADQGSRYWRVSDRNTHYAISSYDVPRYIPASRIGADVAGFFADAENSIRDFFHCIIRMEPNGTVTEHFHEWILRGTDPSQNVFLIDARPNGSLTKEIRFEVPSGSIAIVILRTGANAHLQYGLWGQESMADRTLYVFEDAKNIYMEVPAAIWGSILAPDATYHAHQTGGTVYGNAALGGLAVNPASGFEFHSYPFVGGVVCKQEEAAAPAPAPMPAPAPAPAPRPTPMPAPAPAPRPAPMPAPAPAPRPAPMPAPVPAPRPAPMPAPAPAPRPAPMPAPVPAPRPAPMPAPAPAPRPAPIPAPAPAQCPVCQAPPEAPPCPVCKKSEPCPEIKPCPKCKPCPECAPCPESVTKIVLEPVPIPIPIPYETKECEKECVIEPGLIYGCIWGCYCNCQHDWEVMLYRGCAKGRKLLQCIRVGCCGCFEFHVPCEDYYILCVAPVGNKSYTDACKPMLTLKNVGVMNLMID